MEAIATGEVSPVARKRSAAIRSMAAGAALAEDDGFRVPIGERTRGRTLAPGTMQLGRE
jgi:hypothetical protein